MNVKTTATELPKTTNDQKPAAPAVTTTTPQAVTTASASVAGPIKNASTPISSTVTAAAAGHEGKCNAGVSPAANAEKTPTKMQLAFAIYLRTLKQKDMTRKQVVEQFVAEAKLSAAGASTYYQLIKAKFG